MFQQMQEHLANTMLRFAAKQPGYFEKTLQELKEKGETDGSVTPDEMREAIEKGRVKAKAHPSGDLHLIASMGQGIGDIYTRMRWTVIRAAEGDFVTSDAPVVRRDPVATRGFYGGGLYSSTAQVWFPISKKVLLIITHDNSSLERHSKLLEEGRNEEAEAVRNQFPDIHEKTANQNFVWSLNYHSIINADRFVFCHRSNPQK